MKRLAVALCATALAVAAAAPVAGAAVVLSGLFELGKAMDAKQGAGTLAVATFFAFLSGYVAIAGLLRFLANHSTIVFVVYRVALGVLVLALVGSGVIK